MDKPVEKAVIYARFSSDKQKDESIDQQRERCEEYCAAKGYHVVDVYSDYAISGRSDDRPSFKRMIAEAKAFDVVVVYKIDRFARDRYLSALNRKKLKDAGCRLESATESLGEGIESIILESMFEGMAEYYSAQLAQNTTRGMKDNAKKCKVNGMLPFGYVNQDGYYAINEEEAVVVRRIFELYSSNISFDPQIEFKNYRTRRGGEFTRSIISQIVRNERYRGVYEWGGTRIEDGIPRIVDDSTWFSAQKMAGKRRKKTVHERLYLRGKLFGKSGDQAVGQGTTRGKTHYQYYVVDGEYIERGEIEGLVAGAVRKSILTKEARDEITRVVMEAQEGCDPRAGIEKSLREEIANVEKQKANYVKTIGMIGPDESVLSAMSECDDRLAGLNERLDEELSRQLVVFDELKIEYLLEMMSKESTDKDLIDNWVSLAIVFDDHVTVYCYWDKVLPDDQLISELVQADELVRNSAKWCTEYELARTAVRNALVVIASR